MFNEAKLRGRIVECCGTIGNFAKEMGITPQTMTRRMRGEGWNRAEIAKASSILKIDPQEISAYFFSDCVRKLEHN